MVTAPVTRADESKPPPARALPKRRAGVVARSAVLLCGMFASVMAAEAFVRSPVADRPSVRPYAMAVEQVLASDAFAAFRQHPLKRNSRPAD